MIHIRVGEGWASDPEVRAGLRAPSPEPRRAAIRAIVDVLAVEVDGVDIGAGRTEGPLASGMLGFLRAVERLAAGERHASVPFDDGAVELVLHRRGDAALLSVATLARPARLLAHDVEVDLPRLADAVRAAAVRFCDRVGDLSPPSLELPEIRALLRAASRRPRGGAPRPGAASGTRSRRVRRRPRDATCSFEIHDEEGRLPAWRGSGADLASLLVRGRVAVRAPGGEEFLALDGSPYLLLRDLAAAASRIATAPTTPVLFDLARPGRTSTARVAVSDRGVSVDGAAPVRCDPLAFAQAVLEGASDFCAVVRGRAPGQARNDLLLDLERDAAAALAGVVEAREGDRVAQSRRRIRLRATPGGSTRPLGPGRLRQVGFRPIASHDVGTPAGAGLLRAGERLVASGASRTVALDPTLGSLVWEAPGARDAVADAGFAFLLREGLVDARDLATGSTLWEREVPAGSATRLALGTGGRLLVTTGPAVAAIDARSGRPLWTFTSPGASRVALLPLGPLLLVASDSGMVHALDPRGAVAWRLRGSGPLSAPPVGMARSCLLLFDTPTGACLTGVDPATGRRTHETPLDFAPSGPPIRFAGRLAVPGRVAGEGVVAAVDPDGARAWTEPSPTDGPPSLAQRAGRLFAKGADGTCAALDRDGRTLWVRSRAGLAAAPGNPPPVPARSLVVVPGEEVEVLDAASGTPVGRVPAHGPARMLVDDRLTVWTLDPHGLACGARLRGHLSVLGPADTATGSADAEDAAG